MIPAKAPEVKLNSSPSQSTRIPLAHENGRGGTVRRLELLLVIVLATTYFLWLGWPLFWSASENVRLVGTFNSDEEEHVRLLKDAIDNRFPRLGYIQYGYGYLNMGLYPLFLKSYFENVTEQDIIVWLRIIPAIFAVATITMTFVLARRYFGHLAAWVGAFLLAFVPLNFVEMSSMSHSDVPQVFFLVLSLYFCCRLVEERRQKWFVWACVAAGLAFSCKYTGLFLLPLIWLLVSAQTLQGHEQISINAVRVARIVRLLTAMAGVAAIGASVVVIPYFAGSYGDAIYFGVSLSKFFYRMRLLAIIAGIGLVVLAALKPLWRMIGQRPRLASILEHGVLSLVAFGSAFCVTSPFNVFDVRSGFLRGFLYESLHSSFGHMVAEGSNLLLWLNVLISPELLDGLVLGLAAISLILTLFTVVKSGPWKLLEPVSILWIWVIYYLGFLFLRVNIRTFRTLLPIIPFLIILAAHGLTRLIGFVTPRLSSKSVAVLSIASVLIIVGAESPKSLDQIVRFRQATSQREQTSTAVRAGRWLTEQYLPSMRVLYDQYSYVPPVFTEAFVTPFGGTLELLKTVDPDIVIVSSEIADRFSNIEQATVYVRDENEFMAKHNYYDALRRQESGYVLVQDFGTVQVFARKQTQ